MYPLSVKEDMLYLFTWNDEVKYVRDLGIKEIPDCFLRIERIDGRTLRALQSTKSILFKINDEHTKVDIIVDGHSVHTLNAEKTKHGIKIYRQPTLEYYCFELFNFCVYLMILGFTGMVAGSLFYVITGKSPFELLPFYLLEPIAFLIGILAIATIGYCLLFAIMGLVLLLIIEPLFKIWR